MKKAQNRLGHVEIDYRLRPILDRAVKDFTEAEIEDKTMEQQYAATKDDTLLPKMFAAGARKREAGVVVLISAAALLEQIIYNYATTFLDEDSFEEHLGNSRTLTKWLLLPRLCQNKQVSEDDRAINDLRELIKARNAVVHPKRKLMNQGLEKAMKLSDTEGARFLSACRKAKATVDSLIKLLESPPQKAQQGHGT